MGAGIGGDRPDRWRTVAHVLEWALLLAALGAFTITETYRPYVGWGMGALAASFLLRYVRTSQLLPRTGLEVSLLLFVASAYVGLAAAYDRWLALLLLARILAVVVLYYALVESGGQILTWAALGLVLMAAVLALYWPTQHDFTAEPGKVAVVTAVGQWINAHVPRLPGPGIHSNVAGSTLALALPFATALAWQAWRQRWIVLALAGGGAILLLAAGLFLTSNRGGWLSVGAVGGLGALAWGQRRWLGGGRRATLFWGAVAGLAMLVVLVVAGTGNLDAVLGMVYDPTGSLQGRTRLWGHGLALIRDYAFTGCGLGAFPMVYSTYGILIHTRFLLHIHNTYLEVWIEQGALGALALAWGGVVLARWGWRALRREEIPPLGWAGLGALVTVAAHGLFDVAFYGTRTFPLFGLVLGCAWFAVRDGGVGVCPLGRKVRWKLAAIAGAALLLIALLFHRPLLAAWHANWGALAQTRVELSAYDPDHFDDPTMDQVRQAADLEEAEWAFAQALAWDEGNLTARQRLGALALSRGAYEDALLHLQVAWDAGNRDEATRLLLGDALAAAGRAEEAAEVVRGLTWAERRLHGQAWYRYWINGDYRRAAAAWEAVLLLNPDNADAARWKVQAENRLEE